MPRHPPCALKNLTTKDQKLISREPRKPTTPNNTTHNGAVPSRAARSRFIFLEIASYKRCSRPLCSSQTTTPYTTPHTHKNMHDRQRQETRNTSPTPHTPCQHPQQGIPAKNNGTWSCCLRTQQCAKH